MAGWLAEPGVLNVTCWLMLVAEKLLYGHLCSTLHVVRCCLMK